MDKIVYKTIEEWIQYFINENKKLKERIADLERRCPL